MAAAHDALRGQVDRFPAPGPVPPPAGQISTVTAGTFSAFGVGQMAGGNVQKQQLDALLRIQEEMEKANRVGGIIA